MTTHEVSPQNMLELDLFRILVEIFSDESVRLLEWAERVLSDHGRQPKWQRGMTDMMVSESF